MTDMVEKVTFVCVLALEQDQEATRLVQRCRRNICDRRSSILRKNTQETRLSTKPVG
ncbi:hypothetical protein J4457_06595 [Candidatus Woesearchaeota archaeon]|nr:hypothetical protein [Candidatus Woesearchaeota archaeon]